MKFRLNNERMEIMLGEYRDVENSVKEKNDGQATLFWSPIDKTILVECDNKPKDHPALGIFWEEVEDAGH